MTRSKRVQDAGDAEYQALVRRLESRHGPHAAWQELPVIHRPGRPGTTRGTKALKSRSVKLPEEVWALIADAAMRQGVTTSGVVAGLALEVITRDAAALDRAINRMVSRGVLTRRADVRTARRKNSRPVVSDS